MHHCLRVAENLMLPVEHDPRGAAAQDAGLGLHLTSMYADSDNAPMIPNQQPALHTLVLLPPGRGS